MPAYKDEAWSKEMKSVVSEFRKGAEGYSDDEIESIVDETVNEEPLTLKLHIYPV